MALPAILIYAVNDFLLGLANFRATLQTRRDQLTSTVEYQVIENVLAILVQQRANIVDIKGRSGIGAYAQRVFGDATVDIVARLNALQSAIETAGLNIRTGTPVDGSGYVLAYKLAADPTATNQWAYRTVPSGQTAGLRTDLDTVIAAVDDLFADLSG